MRTFLIFFIGYELVARAAWAQSPLPEDISLTAPGRNIATNMAVFGGAWQGVWGVSLPTALVVERINTNGEARVVYSWGDDAEMGIKAGWSRVTGQVSAGKLHLAMENGATIDFTPRPGGKLSGLYQFKDFPVFAMLERIPGNNPAVIIAAAEKPYVPWKEIRIPLHSQVGLTAGKTLMLQTTIYPAEGPGKHPVIILNHGSTGPGLIPPQQVYRGGSEEALFHSLGYIEVVPMRKGRGASEGPNVEEDFWSSDATTLDSAVEDLHAVIEYLDKLPEVDTNRIVLAGVSRGGFLSAIYPARYPAGICGVLNFSGGWYGEGHWKSGFNTQEFKNAGRNSKVPQLWLYGDHDSFYSLKFDEKEFAEFKAAGGKGDLVEVRDLPGDGHLLMFQIDRWQDAVTNYLDQVGASGGKVSASSSQ